MSLLATACGVPLRGRGRPAGGLDQPCWSQKCGPVRTPSGNRVRKIQDGVHDRRVSSLTVPRLHAFAGAPGQRVRRTFSREGDILAYFPTLARPKTKTLRTRTVVNHHKLRLSLPSRTLSLRSKPFPFRLGCLSRGAWPGHPYARKSPLIHYRASATDEYTVRAWATKDGP